MPAWLKSVVESRTHCGNVIPLAAWRKIARENITDGARHATLLKLIGHFASHGNDEEVVREVMLSWNRDRCEPPLPDGDVVNMCGNIYERERSKQDWFVSKIGGAK